MKLVTPVNFAHRHRNQLRPTRGAEIRQRFGLDAEQVSLGHAQARITEIYAESDAQLAATVAIETG